MDKVAMYKEEIYKRASSIAGANGVGSAIRGPSPLHSGGHNIAPSNNTLAGGALTGALNSGVSKLKSKGGAKQRGISEGAVSGMNP